MSVVLSLDAMGGDRAPEIVLDGAELALESNSDLKFLIFGDDKAEKILKTHPNLKRRSEFHHTTDVVTNEIKPSIALRSGRESSMRKAIDAVKEGKASAVISAGNTGAYMAMSKFVFNTLKGVDRPAIPAVIPTKRGRAVMLDLGANVDCAASNLIQFAIMGEAFAYELLDVSKPSIGLLNVGAEEQKGHASLHEAANILKELPDFNFHGFVEGNDITNGTVDVVVTDGFTGNVALKAIEGTAKLIQKMLKDAIVNSTRGKIGATIARPAFEELKLRSDPRLYNGAVFLGLKNIAVKSHGGTDAIGFANSVHVAAEMVTKNLIAHAQNRLKTVLSEPAKKAS